MPFCKRTIVPKDVCKSRGAMFTDLVDVCGLTLCAVLRQLSDLSRQSVSILEELEGELASICYRSGALENKLISLQKHIAALATKPPVKSRNFSVLYTLFLIYTCVWLTCLLTQLIVKFTVYIHRTTSRAFCNYVNKTSLDFHSWAAAHILRTITSLLML